MGSCRETFTGLWNWSDGWESLDSLILVCLFSFPGSLPHSIQSSATLIGVAGEKEVPGS